MHIKHKIVDNIQTEKNVLKEEALLKAIAQMDMESAASVRRFVVPIISTTNYKFSVVSISCGSSSRDNNTYLRLGPISSFDSSNENCNYRICQTNNKVCRIRLDFNTFSIQGPQLGTTLATAATTATSDGTEFIRIIEAKPFILYDF